MVKTHSVDLLVIGGGSGVNVIPDGISVAVVEKGPMGGTCLNRGCIPSKILIHSADIAGEIRQAQKFGLHATLNKVDLKQITDRATKLVSESAYKQEQGMKQSRNIKLFKGTGTFIGKNTLQVGNDIIKAKNIVIAAGARPMIPNIPGLDKVNYITSTEALRLTKLPKTMTVLGGGYIAVELAHFYGSLGTKVNIIQRSEHLLSREDEEIAVKFTKVFSKNHNVLTDTIVERVWQKGKKIYVEVKNKQGKKTIVSDELLVALGVTPNSDTLDLSKTGVKIDKRGFIAVNDYLETSAQGIYAMGDIIGSTMLKHGANYEAEIIFENLFGDKKVKRDYSAMPHAIFTHPQIAGAGHTEQELQEKKIKYVKGTYEYIKTGMGLALQDDHGFVKILADPKTRKILGCFIMGTQSSTAIHEVLIVMRNNLKADDIVKTIHIHPALSEVIQRAVLHIDWNNIL